MAVEYWYGVCMGTGRVRLTVRRCPQAPGRGGDGEIRLDGTGWRFVAVWRAGRDKVAGGRKNGLWAVLAMKPHLPPIYTPSTPYQTLSTNQVI